MSDFLRGAMKNVRLFQHTSPRQKSDITSDACKSPTSRWQVGRQMSDFLRGAMKHVRLRAKSDISQAPFYGAGRWEDRCRTSYGGLQKMSDCVQSLTSRWPRSTGQAGGKTDVGLLTGGYETCPTVSTRKPALKVGHPAGRQMSESLRAGQSEESF